MPQVKFIYQIDEGEKVNIYIDDALIDETQDSFETQERFKLKIEQYRIHNEKNSALKDILFFLISPIIKSDHFKNLKKTERPFYAYYESECELLTDSEIIITQYKKNYHSIYDVTSSSAVFTNVINDERVNKTPFRNWVISKIFLLTIISSIPLFMIGRIIYEAFVDKDLPILVVGFIMVFCLMFVGVLWYSVFSSLSPKTINKNDMKNKNNTSIKFYRISSFIWVSLGLVSYFVYSINAEFSSAIPCVGGVGIYIIKSLIFDHIKDSNYVHEFNDKHKVSAHIWKGIEFISLILYVVLNIVFQSYFLV